MKRYSDNISNPFFKFYSSLQHKKLTGYEIQIYSKFDLCVTISDTDLNYLKNHCPEVDAITIPAGVNEKLFTYEKKKVKSHSIAHIGHTDWYPNYDSLKWFISDIFPLILDKYPDSKLYVYGGGNTKNFPLNEKIKKNVNIVGFVEDLWDNLSQIEITVVPLRIGGGIRIKILELLATGNTVVSTSIGKEGIEIRNGKHLFISDTAREFAESIIKIFDGFDTTQIATNGRKYIEDNYSWTIIAERFEKQYEQVIAQEK